MQNRTLGRTGISVSPIAIGTWQLAGPVAVDGLADGFPDPGRAQTIALIHACGDLGINCIDTAPIYGGGEGERRVGEAIRGQRQRWIVSTKFGMDVTAAGARHVDTTPSAIAPSLQASLRRLGTDYVDVFMYHAAPELDAILEGREVLESLKRAGKLRAYGISTTAPDALMHSVQRGAAEVVMLEHSLRIKPAAMLAQAERGNLGVMVRGALDHGFLSGRYFLTRLASEPDGAPRFGADDIRSRLGFDERAYAWLQQLRPAPLSMAEFALRYVLDQPTTHTLVLGGRSIEHYRDAVRVADAPSLSPLRHRMIDAARLGLERYRSTRAAVGRVTKPVRARLAVR